MTDKDSRGPGTNILMQLLKQSREYIASAFKGHAETQNFFFNKAALN